MEIAGYAYVQTVEGDGMQCAVIARGSSLFLVPAWIESPDGRTTKLARIILLDALRFQDTPAIQPRWTVNEPIPKAVLEGRASSAELARYRVIEAPDITLTGSRGHH